MIRDGMNSGRYTSESVEQVIFASDRGQISSDNIQAAAESTNQTTSIRAQTSTQISSNDKEDIGFPVFRVVASIVSFIVIAVAIFLVKRRKRNQNIVPTRARRKSVVSFAPSLEQEIPSSYHSSSVGSSCTDGGNGVNAKSEGRTHRREDSKDDNDSVGDSGAGSDMILQWVFKKDKFASNF
jgi:hypothetical protein